MKSIPYVLVDPKPQALDSETYEKTIAFCKHTGFLTILDTDDIHKTLSYSLLQRNIPALTIEVGESYVVNEKNVKYGVSSILNILSYLGMVEPIVESFQYAYPQKFKDIVLNFSNKPISSTSGIIRFLAAPGDIVKKGKQIAKIYNAFGKKLETLMALNDGIVLGHSDFSVAFPGAPVMAFGIVAHDN